MNMELNNSETRDILYHFCGDVPFWDRSTLDVATPVFSSCFLDTVLIWGPCAFLWIMSPFFLIYIYQGKRLTPLPLSKISVSKAICSFLILCTVVLQLIFQEHDGYACNSEISISAAAYTATAIKFLTVLWTAFLQQIQRYRGIKTSGVPFVFWMTLIGCETLSLYTHAQRQGTCSEDVVFYIYFILLVIQFVLHCFPELYSTQGYHEIDDDNSCPDENASVLGQICFEWLTPVVIKCFKNRLNPAEFWNQTSRLKANHLGPLLENAWKDEIHKCEREQ
ncbi:multidrug resistance-associated protein 1-like [Ruditapes philippinarum]|uniref:multidrug resistance-associated protein 1-like n=1 Tax=Ruditapes philippinarum TaxID=129788 RepID=UPI00295B2DDE|nr:multidrug resistance-associated protein 1-like [Ruditapes philippinarum]